jgi:hypothetical protein
MLVWTVLQPVHYPLKTCGNVAPAHPSSHENLWGRGSGPARSSLLNDTIEIDRVPLRFYLLGLYLWEKNRGKGALYNRALIPPIAARPLA